MVVVVHKCDKEDLLFQMAQDIGTIKEAVGNIKKMLDINNGNQDKRLDDHETRVAVIEAKAIRATSTIRTFIWLGGIIIGIPTLILTIMQIKQILG